MPTESIDDPGMSSTGGCSSSTAAGVVVSGSSATATFNNLNQSITGLEPGAGVVARDHAQVTVHTLTVHNHPQSGQQSATNNSADDQIQALLKIIHQNTWEKTAVDIGDAFKADKFPEPNFEVHPQMVESPYFYRGGHPVPVEENDPPRPKKRKLEKVKQPEYKKDYRFTFSKPDVASHRPLSVESLMKKIHEKKDKLSVLGVVAQAGAGKTTCMRRWARRTMTLSGMSKENQFTPNEKSRFQMVHFLDMKSMPMSEISSLQEFLFKDLFENEESTKIAYKWLLQNQNKVAIFLDGLDQAQQNITEQDMKAVGNHGKANCQSILCNLLKRNLLPEVRIILSSREHAAASLPEEAWIRDVITLTGFSEDDAKKLFNAVTAPADDSISAEEDEDASTDQQIKADRSHLVKESDSSITETASVQDYLESNWDKLTKASSSLLSFISIPIFLMFTAIVFNTFGETPSSVTELLVKVFETLPFSVIVKKRKTLPTVIHKLKRLSHTGMEKGFVIFSSEDLTNHDLSKDDVQDLLLMVRRSRSLTNLIEGDNVFFFCHQILQEFLSACFVVEMTLKDFKEFVETCLHEYHWSVVRRFVFGLLFSSLEEIEKLLQVSDRAKKQTIIRQSLTNELGWICNLELLATIYESDDDSLIHAITEIEISNESLGSDGAHLIGSFMARCKELDLLKTVECNIDNDFLRIIAKSIGLLKIQVRKVFFEEYHLLFDFAVLNNFLEHIDSDEVEIAALAGELPRDVKEDGQRCEFDWRNIQQMCVSSLSPEGLYVHDIYFCNTDGSITVTLEREDSSNYIGMYNKKDKILTVKPEEDSSVIIQDTAIAVHWLNRCSVSYNNKEKLSMQYLHGDCMTCLADLDVTGNSQIENILLDFCILVISWQYEQHEKYERDITSIIQKFQVKEMDVVIYIWAIEDLIDKFEHLLRLHDFKLRIHVVARDRHMKSENIQNQFAILKRSNLQIESFQLLFIDEDISLDNVTYWFRNLSEAGVKQFFIVHVSSEKFAEREKLEYKADSRAMEYTFVWPEDLDPDSPWFHFYVRLR